MANIARLGVALGLNTAEFQTGLKGAMTSLEQVKKAAVVVGTATVSYTHLTLPTKRIV